MNYILNIHTATENAIVTLCNGGDVLKTLINSDPKRHASFLHVAINQILKDTNIQPNDLCAVGVTAGPGSYTGIRVGLASAKGLCFALNIPLMILNTLEVMAISLIENINNQEALYCPMIDARRMEVFTSVYDRNLREVIPPTAIVLTEDTFGDLISVRPVYFIGSGIQKFKKINSHIPQSNFLDELTISSKSFGAFAWKQFKSKKFDDVANASALYIKEFYTK
jgi:tRNA threonylcarbamoyladenosine biosynthesis protein TsaB